MANIPRKYLSDADVTEITALQSGDRLVLERERNSYSFDPANLASDTFDFVSVYEVANETALEAMVSAPWVEGDSITLREEGWRFKVAADTATDHHRTEAGKKLYALPGGVSWVNVRACGAVGDGVADDTAAFQAAADMDTFIKVPAGIYRVTDSIVFPGDMRMDFEDGAYIFADTGAYSEGYVLVARGSVTQIADLGADVSKGDVSLTFSTAPDLDFDDTILIFNPTDSSWSGFRTYYKAGEFCRIEDASGTSVSLQTPLYDGYASADVDVYKVDHIAVDLRNPRIESNGSPFGLILAKYARNPQITNPELRNKNNSCIYLNKCEDGDLYGGRVMNKGDGGDDYGLVMSNCQGVVVHGGTWYGRRHGVASGGDSEVGCVPCRGLKYIGCRISNDRASNTHAADMHGNAEYCGFYQCHIEGGVAPQGANVSVVDCDLYGGFLDGPVVYGSEVLGGHYRVTGNRIHCFINPQSTSRGVIDFGGNSAAISANTTRDLNLECTGNTIISDALSALTTLVEVRNSGSSKKMNVEVSGNNFDVNDFGQALRVRLASGTADSAHIICDNNKTGLSGRYSIYPDGDYSALSVLRCQAHRWTDTVTTSTGSSLATGATETFKWRFPREPSVVCNKMNSTYVSNRVGIVMGNPVDTDDARLVLATDDVTNFAVAQAVTVCGEAAIREV